MNKDIAIAKENLPDKEDVKKVRGFFNEIDKMQKKLASTMNDMVSRYYEAGEIVWNWVLNYPGKISVSVAEKAFGIPMRRINIAIKIHKTFEGQFEQIANLSVNEVLKLIREKAESQKREIGYAGSNEDSDIDWEDYFKLKPVANVPLENYRVITPNDNELWLIKRGINTPLKIVDVLSPPTDSTEMKMAHKTMLKNIQAATEEYYSVFEKQEDK